MVQEIWPGQIDPKNFNPEKNGQKMLVPKKIGNKIDPKQFDLEKIYEKKLIPKKFGWKNWTQKILTQKKLT